MKRKCDVDEDIPRANTPRVRLIVGLNKENFGRECNEHSCCGEFLKAGMMIKFRIVDFPTKDGNERAVEVLSQLSELDASYPPPPPSTSPLIRKWCKVGWVHKKDIGEVGYFCEKYGVVAKLFKNNEHASLRKLHYTLNGAASFFVLANENVECGRESGEGGGGGGDGCIGEKGNLKRVTS